MVDIVQIGLSVDSREVDKGTKSLDKLSKQGKKTQSATDKMSSSFKMLGGAIAAIGLTSLIKSTIDTAASFEKMNASLVTVTGSAEKAKQAMDGITAFATSTPFQVEEVTDAFIKLKALGIEPTEANLRSFGNTSSAMGKSLNQMIEAVADAATGEFERLKEFGIKSRSEGDRVKFTFQGVTTEVGKNSKEITEYLENIGNTSFGGAMEKQMDTLDGAFSNFNDSISLAIVKISSESGFTQLIKDATQGVALFVRELTGTESLNDVNTRIEATTKEIEKFKKQIEEAEKSRGESRGFLDYIIGASPDGIIKSAEQRIQILNEQLNVFKAQADEMSAKTGGLDEAGASGKSESSAVGASQEDLDAEFERMSEHTDLMLEQMAADDERKLEQKQSYLDKMLSMEVGAQQAALDFGNAIRAGEYKASLAHGASMLDGLAKTSKTAFGIQKAFSLAKATAALPSAIMDSFNNGGGYPWGLVPAGLMLATGLQQINAIKSATFGGGASVPSVSGSGSASTSAPVASGLPPGSTATPEETEQPAARELRVTVEGDGPHSEGMRKFAKNLSETIKDMGGVGSLVLS